MITVLKWAAYAVCILVFGFTRYAKAQTAELEFKYDLAGNQIERKFVCINCTIPFPYALVAKVPDESGNLNSPKSPTKVNRTITGYPNPLKETLNLKWDVSDKYHITKVEVVSQTGLSVFKQEFGVSATYLEQTTVPFQRQVPGTYMVMVTYSDGKQVVIKVVKI